MEVFEFWSSVEAELSSMTVWVFPLLTIKSALEDRLESDGQILLGAY